MIRSASSLREFVRSMPAEEAREYVLAAYEDLAGQQPEWLEECAALKLSPMLSVIFCCLRRRLGQVTANATMLSACDATRPDPVCESTFKVQVHYLRRRLAGHYRIVTVWGQGYRLEPEPPANS